MGLLLLGSLYTLLFLLSQHSEVTIRHIKSETARKGERTGCLQVRKHIARCFRNRPGAGALRRQLFSHETSDSMVTVLEEAVAAWRVGAQPLKETG